MFLLKELGLNGTLIAAIVQFIILSIPAIALIVIGYILIKSKVKK